MYERKGQVDVKDDKETERVSIRKRERERWLSRGRT